MLDCSPCLYQTLMVFVILFNSLVVISGLCFEISATVYMDFSNSCTLVNQSLLRESFVNDLLISMYLIGRP